MVVRRAGHSLYTGHSPSYVTGSIVGKGREGEERGLATHSNTSHSPSYVTGSVGGKGRGEDWPLTLTLAAVLHTSQDL